MSEPEPVRELTDIEHVRSRAGMYLGSTDFFGFIQYVVSAFDVLLDHGATWIEFSVGETYQLTSDAIIPTHLNNAGQLVPFEAIGALKPRHLPDALILLALSGNFRVAVCNGQTQTILEASSGERDTLRQEPDTQGPLGTTLNISADDGIFSVMEVSPLVVHSYCKRTACLHPGVEFRIKLGDEITVYKSTKGIRDFFAAVSTPYQILHQPIYLKEIEGNLSVETIFVFHSWTENLIWSFANKGRVPDGGTHIAGMEDAIANLYSRQGNSAVGILGVLAIEHPEITYEGCIKARIGNPELRGQVCNLITRGLEKWVSEHPDEVEYFKKIERFQFGNIW